MADDYYGVLGVPKDASDKDIKKAFRRIARECHPDVVGEDEALLARFKAAKDAYEVLSDPVARDKYDRRLARRGQRVRTGGSFRDAFYRRTAGMNESTVNARAQRSHQRSKRRVNDPSNNLDLEDLFNDFGFGGSRSTRSSRSGSADAEPGPGRTRTRTSPPPRSREERHRPPPPQPGRDVHIDLDVPEPIARDGGVVTAVYHRMQRSDAWRPGSPDPGIVRIQDLHDVRLLPGTRDGEVLHEKGRGDAGAHGGPYGDLVVRVRVVVSDRPPEPEPTPDPPPRVEDRVVDISVGEAVLGGRVEVDTPQGRVRITVPAGTHSGTRMRLRGKGPSGPDGPTDLMVRLRIVVPQALDAESRELLERFAALNPPPRR